MSFAIGDNVVSTIDYQKMYPDPPYYGMPAHEKVYRIREILEEIMILNGEEKKRVGLVLSDLPYYRYYNAENFRLA